MKKEQEKSFKIAKTMKKRYIIYRTVYGLYHLITLPLRVMRLILDWLFENVTERINNHLIYWVKKGKLE